MSLVHNIKQFSSGEGKQINSSSYSIAMFYIMNPNATKDEIDKFSEEHKIKPEEVRIFSKYEI